MLNGRIHFEEAFFQRIWQPGSGTSVAVQGSRHFFIGVFSLAESGAFIHAAIEKHGRILKRRFLLLFVINNKPAVP